MEFSLAQDTAKRWQALLAVQSQRNMAGELSIAPADPDHKRVSYRARVFEVMKDGAIIVELPMQALADRAFLVGDDVDLVLMEKDERLAGRCRIREFVKYQFNESTQVTSLLLAPASKTFRDQRRSFYRVNVAGADLELAELIDISNDQHRAFKARPINLSAGGLGVLASAPEAELRKLRNATRVKVNADFGGESVKAEAVVNYIEARESGRLYIGLQFDPSSEAHAQALEDQMHQLCTNYQRMQLKRRRA